MTSHGLGPHNLETVTKKSVLESVSVISSGDGYENKKRSCGVTGVSTSLNTINIKNHDYKSGEIIKYAAGSSAISGLTDGTEYYVIKLDDDNFQLANVGLTTSTKRYFYDTNQYVNLALHRCWYTLI